uniref:Uncharacterized protein LOC100182309 n=1 Tax=Phallusia mammillata TaxID=59560 RepID=A0A6F9DGY2_9ASCI|nr:uncharacterized protein LOC100182309 [Phallusia mammillata]
MKFQRYTRQMRKNSYKPYLIGVCFLVCACALIAVATFTQQVYGNLKSMEEELRHLKQHQTVKSSINERKHVINKRTPSENVGDFGLTRGTTYIRWGRRDCPSKDGTQLVYEGYAAGAHYSHVGAGSDFLCLHSDPTYTPGRYIDGWQGTAHVHGVEYRDSSARNVFFDLSLIEEEVLQYQGVPCAVCFVSSPTKLMIPSRETCPDGWTIEYTGYIMTGGHSDTKHSSSHICVDDTPQAIPATQGNQNGAYLYVAEIGCAHNIPCEPYVSGREITCVVCSYL